MLRNYRKKRRPGNRAPTSAEAERIAEAKVAMCIPCLVWAEAGNMPAEHVATCCDYDHSKSGNIRIGHGAGFASCGWHHRGLVDIDRGWTHARMREHFGPSLMDGSRLFHEAYGTDAELIARQDELLAEPA